MAGTDPRRSSRARNPQTNNSSSASSTSGRSERNTRSFNKAGSAQKSASASLSSEPPDDVPNDNPPTTRRRKRGLDNDKYTASKADSYEMAIDDDIQEDDEVVRCICGFEEYPGPPPYEHDSKYGRDIDSEPISVSEMTEDLAGFFLQCDTCNVWQHGACFGITDDASAPKEYFCELCRPSLHKTYKASNGQRYSCYLPLKRSLRASSRASSHAKDETKSPQETIRRNGRLSSTTQTSKRRSTMNSRYDEEEQLRLAIEASKEDALPDHVEPQLPSRHPKRGRSDSEEYMPPAPPTQHSPPNHPDSRKPDGAKRQKTDSRSVSPLLDKPPSATPGDSADTITMRNGISTKKGRSTVSRNQREKSEREEREKPKAEVTKKRNVRGERWRAEDSPSEEIPLSLRAAPTNAVEPPVSVPPQLLPPPPPVPEPVEPPPASEPSPDFPQANSTPIASSLHKKSSRPSHRKTKGRNQYSKDREEHEGSPVRGQSNDGHRNGEENGTNSHNNHKSSDHCKGTHNGKHIKANVSSKVSIADMNRRANVIMDFITRTQLDMAGEAYTPRHPNRRSTDVSYPLLTPKSDDPPRPSAANGASVEDGINRVGEKDREFKQLSSMEMMDFLSREIIQWQKEYCPPELRG